MELRSFEKATKDRLIKSLGSEGEQIFTDYQFARNLLFTEVLPQIRAAEPDLTEHGPNHITNVIDNAELLIGEQGDFEGFCPIHAYVLLTSILFHDVGNVFGRQDHQHKVEKVYNTIWTGRNRHAEKDLVMRIAAAHCGITQDGKRDTLRNLSNKIPFRQKAIRAQEVAAILRLADELAEGPQRTSAFMESVGLVKPAAAIYHRYASVTQVTIDRGNKRIALTYYIDSKSSSSGALDDEEGFKRFLDFVVSRVRKLHQERQYAKHYTDWLADFKRTTVALNFSINNETCDHAHQEYNLTDLVVPGDHPDDIPELRAFSADAIVNKLHESIR